VNGTAKAGKGKYSRKPLFVGCFAAAAAGSFGGQGHLVKVFLLLPLSFGDLEIQYLLTVGRLDWVQGLIDAGPRGNCEIGQVTSNVQA
jgi:hypothetical protein